MPLAVSKYTVIYADPPWPESNTTSDGRSRRWLANSYYSTMTAEQILSMGKIVKLISAPNSVLFLWSTPRHLPLALDTVVEWGFQFVVVGFTWMKCNKSDSNPFFGMGYYTRSNAEFCLLGRKGKPKPVDKTISSAVYEPRREHSKKPDTVRYRIEKLFGPVRRLELFARQQHDGWDVWGNEVQCQSSIVERLFGAVLSEDNDE